MSVQANTSKAQTNTSKYINQLEEELSNLRLKRRAVKTRLYAMKQSMPWQEMITEPEWIDYRLELAKLTQDIQELVTELSKLTSANQSNIGKRALIQLGSQVTLENDAGETSNYRLVDSFAADPAKGMISDESPLGKKLLGKALYQTVAIFSRHKFNRRSYRIIAMR